MLLEEIQNGLVSTGILVTNMRVRQISPSRHPTMDLVRKGLHMVGHLQLTLKLFDIFSGVLASCQKHEWNRDIFCSGGVDHSRVAGGSNRERVFFAGGDDFGNFTTPAELFDILVYVGIMLDSLRRNTYADKSPRRNGWVCSLEGRNILGQSSGRALRHVVTKPFT